MEIREARATDVEAIRDVARAAWEADYPEILSRETVEAGVQEWYDADHLKGELAGSRTRLFVASEDGRVVGFAHAELGRDDQGYLLRLYVHPDARREGVGNRLLERTRDDLFEHGATRINAMVLAENDLGNEFYRGFGFEKVSEGETTIGGNAYRENTYALERA